LDKSYIQKVKELSEFAKPSIQQLHLRKIQSEGSFIERKDANLGKSQLRKPKEDKKVQTAE